MCRLCLVPDANKSTVGKKKRENQGNLDIDIFDTRELFSNFVRFNMVYFLEYLYFNVLELPTKIFMDVMICLRFASANNPWMKCIGSRQG